jgi:hypothetical protein
VNIFFGHFLSPKKFRIRSSTEATEGDERCEQKKPKSDFHNPRFDSLRWQ